ncbi:CLUMA_CG003944, isoform A [Clunio marinus]|uniref:CLUMA_CG003944, isoform A n=1 Tax=Clunio marinus TaxID=568069 RepID=A0A1J1HQA8_9DIPT|nr:CLUMA_CG003944, isoform A [Clunio marinus]
MISDLLAFNEIKAIKESQFHLLLKLRKHLHSVNTTLLKVQKTMKQGVNVNIDLELTSINNSKNQ